MGRKSTSRKRRKAASKDGSGDLSSAAPVAIQKAGEGRDRQPPAAEGIRTESKWRNWQIGGICALLVILVFAVFGQTIRFKFINYDDNEYVYENPVVSQGISFHGVWWAFTHVHAQNWHPFTTLLHMCNCQYYGLWAGGHHLTNVLLHAAVAALLFLVLLDMTGAFWRSGFVAAVFAIHPLRVESVAWVSELKDVLSGVFFMLILWAYGRYARRPESKRRYAIVVLFFVAGLLSKPMLVTVPFLLLLLDYWPLRRLTQISQLPPLLKEKLPFIVLSVASCIATVIAQKQAIDPIDHVPLSLRLGNALVAYVVYIWKLIYPSQLAVSYPLLIDGLKTWQVTGACLLLVAVTTAACILRRNQPYLLVGWLWYLGMLVPVIGILQVGHQAYADHYTYLPEIGLCIAGTWSVAEWNGLKRMPRLFLLGTAVFALCGLTAVAFQQTTYWYDSDSLWVHTLKCTKDNEFAYNNLGDSLLLQGRTSEAIADYREALRINPAFTPAENNLGVALIYSGDLPEGIMHLEKYLEVFPGNVRAHYNLADALIRSGRLDDAEYHFRKALELKPDYSEASFKLALALAQEGKFGEAVIQYQKVLQAVPDSLPALNNLAWLLSTSAEASIRDGARAVQLAEHALKLTKGRNASVLDTLAAAYAKEGDFSAAVQTAKKALQLAEAEFNIRLSDSLRREIELYEAGRQFQ